MFYRLAYVSSSVQPMSVEAIGALLEVSRRNNLRDDITGFLCCRERMFFQLLEGRQTEVEACYARIRDDPRHDEPAPILMEETETRSVPDFSMAYITRRDLRAERAEVLHALQGFRSRELPRTNDPAVTELIATFTGALARQKWSGEGSGMA
ncbi:BLUF domain-containing protein [Wenxinia saemankumensis]|uniref:Sensors of blue-light using FAD n=1 Tax=Wenxinia saemankumensis TaxID=1447782 RepID=A0A1M6HS50_9RHOB|nr:BLUF domain-containing protein [Wenxinia saemankumensis]SHJ24964.1 Sensors of blue-light using FAD [Wenxinia saemankumensis]